MRKIFVPAGVETFSFKLDTGTLSVKTWMGDKALFYFGVLTAFFLTNLSIEHVFIDCWDALLFRDVLQRTIKKDLPYTPYGMRLLDIEPDVYKYYMFFLVGLHSIWPRRKAVPNCEDARPLRDCFKENVLKLCEVYTNRGYDDGVLSIMEQLSSLKRF